MQDSFKFGAIELIQEIADAQLGDEDLCVFVSHGVGAALRFVDHELRAAPTVAARFQLRFVAFRAWLQFRDGLETPG